MVVVGEGVVVVGEDVVVVVVRVVVVEEALEGGGVGVGQGGVDDLFGAALQGAPPHP